MRVLCIGLLTVLFTLPGTAQTKLADFTSMAGCWERRDDAKKVIVSEQWMAPEGSSILGMGRTVKDGKTVDWEFMRIEQRADGIYFVAKPKANPAETDFKLISTTPAEFIFENKAHDFPQRVIYKPEAATLKGRIEGTNKGKTMGLDFPMIRIKCS